MKIKKILSLLTLTALAAPDVFAKTNAAALPSQSLAARQGVKQVQEAPKEVVAPSLSEARDFKNTDTTSSNDPAASSWQTQSIGSDGKLSGPSAGQEPSMVPLKTAIAEPDSLNDHPQAARDTADEAFELSSHSASKPHLDFGLGYVDSRWNKIGPRSKRGSIAFTLGTAREFMTGVEAGLSLALLEGANASRNDSLFAMHVAFNARYLLMPGRFRPFAGLGIGFGNYEAWSVLSESSTTISYSKDGSGILVGVLPEIGFRAVLTPHT